MSNEPFGACPQLAEDVQPVFQDICQDLASLNGKWRLYLDLFSGKETVALLNEMAMGAFQTVEEALRIDLTMSICRLSDPLRSSGQENLSLEVLVQKLKHVPGLAALWQDFKSKCDPVRRYRNKRVGHNDLNVALKPHENPLPGVGRSVIEGILASAGRIVNHAYQAYVNGEMRFEALVLGDGKALVFALKMAKQREDEERDRMLHGTSGDHD